MLRCAAGRRRHRPGGAPAAQRHDRRAVDDKDYLAAERKASAAGLTLLGFYHSHPDHPAEPSQYDLDHAFPTFVYPIVSIRQGEPTALRAWRLRDDRSGYHEQPVADIAGAAGAS
jgi:proteasome lid subunit RPN8/RPN11